MLSPFYSSTSTTTTTNSTVPTSSSVSSSATLSTTTLLTTNSKHPTTHTYSYHPNSHSIHYQTNATFHSPPSNLIHPSTHPSSSTFIDPTSFNSYPAAFSCLSSSSSSSSSSHSQSHPLYSPSLPTSSTLSSTTFPSSLPIHSHPLHPSLHSISSTSSTLTPSIHSTSSTTTTSSPNSNLSISHPPNYYYHKPSLLNQQQQQQQQRYQHHPLHLSTLTPSHSHPSLPSQLIPPPPPSASISFTTTSTSASTTSTSSLLRYKLASSKLKPCSTSSSFSSSLLSKPNANPFSSSLPDSTPTSTTTTTNTNTTRTLATYLDPSIHFQFPSNHAPKNFPLTPHDVVSMYASQLSPYELIEIYSFPTIYYWGQTIFSLGGKKEVGSTEPINNHGYDDNKGDYRIQIHDQFMYRYEVMESLGKGSFGHVVKALDHKTHELVAIKIIRNRKRFTSQGEIELSILRHLKAWDPENRYHCVQMKDTFFFREHLCIVFELLSINLYDFIKGNDFHGFSLTIIRRFTLQLIECLMFLFEHQLLHCDLKPENVLLQSASKSTIKIIDFGSSCLLKEKAYTYIQSRFYRSPEVILGANYDMAIDMWSLGCILAELCTGAPLFPGENEQDQLWCMMEVLGPPDPALLEISERQHLFFDANGCPFPFTNSKNITRKVGSKSLSTVLKCRDELFLDFLNKCLIWVPSKRMKPKEAMSHPWMTKNLIETRSVTRKANSADRKLATLHSRNLHIYPPSISFSSSNPTTTTTATTTTSKRRTLPPIAPLSAPAPSVSKPCTSITSSSHPSSYYSLMHRHASLSHLFSPTSISMSHMKWVDPKTSKPSSSSLLVQPSPVLRHSNRACASHVHH